MAKEHIGAYIHCAHCLNDRPDGQSPREWARLNVGWTREGLQVVCTRCDMNVLDLDFKGQKVAADSTAEPKDSK